MRFTREQEADANRRDLPLTTLIDVVFLLLVFFMVTATLSTLESRLSSALKVDRQGGPRVADLEPLIVSVETVQGSPGFRLGQRVVRTRQSLTNLLDQLSKDTGVVVRVAGDVPVGATAAALQACRDAGFSRISYVPGQ